MKILDLLSKKRVLILGFGKEGKDVFLFLRKLFPKKEIGIADENEAVKQKLKKVKWHLGKNYLESLDNYDLIIKSPGIKIHFPEVEKAIKEGKIITPTQILFELARDRIIGITGTKGKSTTTKLIYHILKKASFDVKIIGNIGKPYLMEVLSSKESTLFVTELSSHQLFGLKKSPHIAVFLNFFPEHLDYYKDLREYFLAKANITLWQEASDFFVFNKENKFIRELAKKTKAKKIPFSRSDNLLKKYSIEHFPFPGDFYLLNLNAAIKVAEIFSIKKGKVKEAIESFKTLPHRLEFVGKFKGIYFYNDSLSTIPQTAILALKAFKGKVATLIAGGFDRGLDFKDLAKEILKQRVKNLILFPTTGEKIFTQVKNQKWGEKPSIFFVTSMKEAVKIAFKRTPKNKICLLSPASPSFGIFRNYQERGSLFKKFVKYYGKRG